MNTKVTLGGILIALAIIGAIVGMVVLLAANRPSWLYVDNGYDHALEVVVDGEQRGESPMGGYSRIQLKPGSHRIVVRKRSGEVLADETRPFAAGSAQVFNPGATVTYELTYAVYSESGQQPGLTQPTRLGQVAWHDVSQYQHVFTAFPSSIKARKGSGSITMVRFARAESP